MVGCRLKQLTFGPSVLFVFFVSSVFSVFPGCDTAPARAEQAPTASAVTWRPLGTWSGRGSRQTESFDVITGALRLRWQTGGNSEAAGPGHFRVSLYSAISGRPLQVIVGRQGPGDGVAYVEDEPRVSYLVIESDQIQWSAALEEAVARSATAP